MNSCFELKREILDDLSQKFAFHSKVTDVFVNNLLKEYHYQICAILFHGSCLSDAPRSQNSLYDFFLVTETYRKFYAREVFLDSVLSRIFPPNCYQQTYHDPICGEIRCKFDVIDLKDFKRETAAAYTDIYHIGRLSKRIGIVFAANENIFQTILTGCFNAICQLIPLTLWVLDQNQIELQDFIKTLLAVSYLGGKRLDKPNQIFLADADYYRLVFPKILYYFSLKHPGIVDFRPSAPVIHFKSQGVLRWWGRKYKDYILRKSQLRMYFRWAKNLVTTDD